MSLKKIVAAGVHRKTRFHDELDNRVSAMSAARHLIPAISSSLARMLFDYREVRPWISYDGQAAIRKHLNRQSRVLEFGYGMSTVWFSMHSGNVVSIEDYEPWFVKVKAMLDQRQITNVDYRLIRQSDEYATLSKSIVREGFDLIMIDGTVRDKCAESAIQWIKPGGVIYLDNSDMAGDHHTGDVPKARETLADFAARTGSAVTSFTDFSPNLLFVTQGLMVRLPRDPKDSLASSQVSK